MKIPFVDLQAQYRALKPQVDAAIQRVLDRAAFIMGSELGAFEDAFAVYIGAKHAVGLSSGTDALVLALRACGIGPGDEVITASNTYFATCEAISHVGATFRWVEVDPRTYNMDPARIEAAITPKTKALLPVHLYGQPADMDPIMQIAPRYGLKVIEDACQAHGALYRGRKAGTFGDAGCFSFYPGKNLGAYGDGGAVVTDDDAVADKVRLLRNHGQREKYVHLIEGGSQRLDNLQAAVLQVKLPHLEEWNEARCRAARRYDEMLCETPGVIVPYVSEDVAPVYHLYVIQVPDRDRVQGALREAGVETGLHYPIPLHELPAYRHLGYHPQDYPITHALAGRILSLPMFPEITEAQIEYVVQRLRMALAA